MFGHLVAGPAGAGGAQGAHSGRVVPPFGGDMAAVAKGVQPASDPGQRPCLRRVFGALGDGDQDGAHVFSNVQVTDRFCGEAPGRECCRAERTRGAEESTRKGKWGLSNAGA